MEASLGERAMREAPVEKRLVDGLTLVGFKVLKLTTPGTNGTPDRLILRPTWSPGPPWVIEVKAPKKHEQRLQELVREEWRKRGILVLDMVDTYEKVDALIKELHGICFAAAPISIEAIMQVTLHNRLKCPFHHEPCRTPALCRNGCHAS